MNANSSGEHRARHEAGHERAVAAEERDAAGARPGEEERGGDDRADAGLHQSDTSGTVTLIATCCRPHSTQRSAIRAIAVASSGWRSGGIAGVVVLAPELSAPASDNPRMARRLPTLVRTGKRAARSAARLAAVYRLARELAPEGFTAEQTTELPQVRARVPAALALRLRAEVAAALRLRTRVMPLRLLSVQACGPISLHDDKFRYPGVYFVIVVAHAVGSGSSITGSARSATQRARSCCSTRIADTRSSRSGAPPASIRTSARTVRCTRRRISSCSSAST